MKEQKRVIERDIRREIRAILTDKKARLRHAKQGHKWGVVAELDAYIMGMETALRIVDSVNRTYGRDHR
jgi:hypothetical protein